jgi:hypothetical protein
MLSAVFLGTFAGFFVAGFVILKAVTRPFDRLFRQLAIEDNANSGVLGWILSPFVFPLIAAEQLVRLFGGRGALMHLMITSEQQYWRDKLSPEVREQYNALCEEARRFWT